MSELTTEDQTPTGTMNDEMADAASETLDVAYAPGESPADVGADRGETAREVAAQHLGRLLYEPVNSWSRYVFHENDPHPFGG